MKGRITATLMLSIVLVIGGLGITEEGASRHGSLAR